MHESPHRKLAEKLDTNIMGIPKKDGDFSPAFMEYLELLYTPEEAELASFLPVDPGRMTAEELAEKAGRPKPEVEEMLARLSEKRVIIGIQGIYVLPPVNVLVNIHQFREDINEDAMRASELYQDFFINDGFYRFYQASAKGTLRRRTVPVDQSVSEGQQILSHEEIGAFLDRASMGAMALVRCPCRSRTEKMGTRECKDKYPVASCLVIGMPAPVFVERGDGKTITREEADQYVQEMRDLGLVILTDNAVEMTDGVICFCCGCCCSVTRGLTRWDNPKAFARSNFTAHVGDECEACGTCVDRCFFGAISLSEDTDEAKIDETRCMGCGVCTAACPTGALRLERLEREPIYADSAEVNARVAAENEEAGQRRPSE
jgi:ferredoxin